MKLNDLAPRPGATADRKRVGRGAGSGTGKTSGRGQKGQRSRAGGKSDIRAGFEGGQMPLQRRLPKRGFVNLNRREYAEVNLAALTRYAGGTDISPELLLADGVISKLKDGVVILGKGELEVSLQVSAHRFSQRAREQILAAGGSVQVLK